MLDIFALSGMEWVHGKVEVRFGGGMAWVVTIALATAFVGAIFAVLMSVN